MKKKQFSRLMKQLQHARKKAAAKETSAAATVVALLEPDGSFYIRKWAAVNVALAGQDVFLLYSQVALARL